jgi:hypothetical protein
MKQVADYHLVSRIHAFSESVFVVSVAILPVALSPKARAEVLRKRVTTRAQAIDARAYLVLSAGATVRTRGDRVVDVIDE